MLTRILVALVAMSALAFPEPSHAQSPTCQAIPVTCSAGACTAVSIAAGGFTTDAFDGVKFHTLKVVGNVTDANTSVTKIEHAFTENFAPTGQFEAYPFCKDDAPTLTCGALKVSWNPAAEGKFYTFWIPWKGRFGKVAITPTGHGSGDVLRLEVYGCY